jgi:hypothetical protein
MKFFFALLACITIFSSAFSQEATDRPPPPPMHGAPPLHPITPGERPPPPEAIAPCVGKVNGARCEFSDRHNKHVVGMCFSPTQGPSERLKMACRP